MTVASQLGQELTAMFLVVSLSNCYPPCLRDLCVKDGRSLESSTIEETYLGVCEQHCAGEMYSPKAKP